MILRWKLMVDLSWTPLMASLKKQTSLRFFAAVAIVKKISNIWWRSIESYH